MTDSVNDWKLQVREDLEALDSLLEWAKPLVKDMAWHEAVKESQGRVAVWKRKLNVSDG